MVTLDRQVSGKLLMTIPNQMMRKFIADFLLHGYADACKVNTRTMELADLLGNIAYGGDWRPAIDMAAAVLKETLSVRDLMDGEKAIQAALAALLSTGTALAVRTEHRTGYGFADLALVPRIITFPDIQQGAIIEVKYIKKTEPVTESTKAVLLAAAKAQLEQYAADHHLAEEWRLKPQGPVNLLRLCIVFHGEELLFAEEI